MKEERIAAEEPPERSRADQIGAYAIILDGAGALLLVEGDTGRFYLPGGRVEAEETPRQALLREIAEECGCSAALGEAAGEAPQPIFGGRIVLLATYWLAELGERLHDRPEHRMVWIRPDEAPGLLHRAADRNAVARVIAAGTRRSPPIRGAATR